MTKPGLQEVVRNRIEQETKLVTKGLITAMLVSRLAGNEDRIEAFTIPWPHDRIVMFEHHHFKTSLLQEVTQARQTDRRHHVMVAPHE